MSSNDSMGAGGDGQSEATVTSTLSRKRTSSICSGLKRKTRSEGFHCGRTVSGTEMGLEDEMCPELRRPQLEGVADE